MKTPVVSVVIVTRDRFEPLQRCIFSILDNTFRDLEIVVLDNGSPVSSNATSQFLNSLKTSVTIKHIVTSPKGFAAMRQQAMTYATGAIIMSIDDDCVADPDAIKIVVDRFSSEVKLGILGGKISNVTLDGRKSFKGRGKIGINGQFVGIEDHSKADAFGAANMSLRKEAFERIGGYDLEFSSGLEEVDLTLRVKQAGYEVAFEPAVKITHYHVPGGLRNHSLWNNVHTARLYLYFKHFMPQNVREWASFGVDETRLLLQDARTIAESIIVSVRRSAFGIDSQTGEELPADRAQSNGIVLKLRKIIIPFTARLMIPVLIMKARRRRTELVAQRALT